MKKKKSLCIEPALTKLSKGVCLITLLIGIWVLQKCKASLNREET